ncbi:MAG: M23 family metallopeptidase [Campylobacteraceae bacterium]|nr:M23 family metallopeptidase [Campylobacteraceae bacterium]
MNKFLLSLFLSFVFLSANNLDIKISSNKKNFKLSQKKQKTTTLKIKDLAFQIKKQDFQLKKLEVKISLINKDIKTHETLLNKSQGSLKKLLKSSSHLKYQKKEQEEQIVNVIINNFTSSIALELASKDSLDALINQEIYNLLSQHSKDKLLKIDSNYLKISQDKRKNEQKIKEIASYIKGRIKKRELIQGLKKRHSKDLLSLETKHKLYQKALKKVVLQQNKLSSLLGKLNILKVKQNKKAKARLLALKKSRAKRLRAQRSSKKSKAKSQKEVSQRYSEEIDLDVRMIGSSTRGIKISKYRGPKTIAPLKSYTIIKKFGNYYDSVYKIKLFNESIVLKTNKRKSKVFNVLNGKIVYAKKASGLLENVVIVQHSKGLHTIYSHLDQISPTLRVGKWIKKGYVVGRVDYTLTFQATKDSYHINPQDLFR